MDDRKTPAEGPGHPLQGPHWRRGKGTDLPPDFLPLRLVLQPGGLALELTRPDVTVGRHTQADVRLQLPDVSRRHCRFVYADGRWQVFDLNSLNGIFLNGERVGQAVVAHHDTIQIGSCLFQVSLPGADASASEQVLESIAEALPRPAGGSAPGRVAS